jgi:hypothetical protein
MARHKDANWSMGDPVDTWAQVQVAVLMDIRDELKISNRCLLLLERRLNCQDFLDIPSVLRRISANTHRSKRRRKVK